MPTAPVPAPRDSFSCKLIRLIFAKNLCLSIVLSKSTVALGRFSLTTNELVARSHCGGILLLPLYEWHRSNLRV